MAMTVVDKDCTKKAECFVNTVAEANYERGYKDGYAKAIEEFAEKLKESMEKKYRHLIDVDRDGFEWLTTDAVETHIDETVKEMKGE